MNLLSYRDTVFGARLAGTAFVLGLLPARCNSPIEAMPGDAQAEAPGRITGDSVSSASNPATDEWITIPAAVREKLLPPHRPDRLLVRFRQGRGRRNRQSVHAAAGAARTAQSYRHVGGLELVEIRDTDLASALALYSASPEVVYAEPDYIVHAVDFPNDPSFSYLWGLYNTGQPVNGDPGTAGADIRALQAWKFWSGDPQFRIAILDTGVNYDHPDLVDNIWTNPGEIPDNGIDDDVNGWVDDIHGYDFINNDPDPMDDNAHGSHTAGTIGG